MLKYVHKFVLKTTPGLYNPLLKIYQRFFDFESKKLRKIITSNLKVIAISNSPVSFISIGTNDGFSNDPFVEWVVQSDCTANFVEPVPDVFEKLVLNYKQAVGTTSRLNFHQVAISDTVGMVDFYAVRPEAKIALGENIPSWFNQLGSFDRNHITKHLNGILEPFIYTISIDTYTLDGFLQANLISKVDVLHIDAEGHDYKIFSSLNLERYCPFLILIEHKHLDPDEKQKLVVRLQESNYQIQYFKSDLLAIRQKL